VLQVHDILLSEACRYLSKLNSAVGDRFGAAIQTCIKGIPEDSTQEALHEVRLQKDFTGKVVENPRRHP
jgi:hypothetical protein